MEIDINIARQWGETVITNAYQEKDVPEILRQYNEWFKNKEGWYDVTVNPNEYMGQGIVTVFMENFYKTKK